jgi:hypothetical protein
MIALPSERFEMRMSEDGIYFNVPLARQLRKSRGQVLPQQG